MKVVFEHSGKEGMIQYSEGDHQAMVTHPDKRVRDLVNVYLNKERDFTVGGPIPEGCRGGRLRLTGRALDSADMMGMALSEMRSHIDASVNWDDPRNRESMSVRERNMKMINEEDKNDKADKPIIKSLDGDTDYEIIN